MTRVSRPFCASLLIMILGSCSTLLPKPGAVTVDPGLVACGPAISPPVVPPSTTRQTGRIFDLAIQGDGYFTLRDWEAQKNVFTRYDRFRLTAEGALTSADGHYVVEPQLTIPTDSIATEITTDGFLLVKQPCNRPVYPGVTPKCDLQTVGQFILSRFSGQQGLREISPGMYELACGGTPRAGAPGLLGAGTLMAGALEEPVTSAVPAPSPASPYFLSACYTANPVVPLPRANLK